MIKVRPSFPDVGDALAQALINSAGTQDSMNLLRTAALARLDDANLQYKYGALALKNRQLDAAVESLTRAVSLGNREADCHYNLALALMQAKRPRAAIDQYLACLRVQPNHISARANLGNALYAIRESAKAVPHFEYVLAKEPNHAAAHYNFGNVLSDLARHDEASQHYAEASRLARPGSALQGAAQRKLTQRTE